ncbi:TPA: hypothetical protein G8M32_005190 [Salmonella enterica]|nr:hypothetical protein [Salmonella enterica subsp. enterica serovar Oranienburg]EGF6148790.1 hypothetical protein [Salmonella enterica]HAF5791946.1 hypothetical protein [Salmonella enterica]
MNKVMNEENRRHGGRNTLCRLFRSGRWFLCLALLCSVMLPGFADAATGDFCENLDGGDIHLKLPPSVTVQPGQNTFPDIPDVTARYRCIAPGKGNAKIYPIIIYRSDGGNFLTALKQLGLKMDIYITDTNGGKTGHWTIPDSQGAISPEYVEFGNNFVASTGTGERTMTIRATLSRATSQSKPGFYVLPSLSAFRLLPHPNSTSGPFLITPPLRLQYVPKCFVKTTVPPFVKFGPVMTTDVNSSFSVTRIFQVTADADFICGGMDNNVLKDPVKVTTSGGSADYYLDLPLKVSFIPQGDSASDISDNGTSLLLRNDEKKINGLKLQIFNEDTPVTFGDISTSGIRPPDTNKFGNFYGSDSGGHWHAPKDYKAVLSSTGGPVLTGSYNAQVLVKVEYY